MMQMQVNVVAASVRSVNRWGWWKVPYGKDVKMNSIMVSRLVWAPTSSTPAHYCFVIKYPRTSQWEYFSWINCENIWRDSIRCFPLDSWSYCLGKMCNARHFSPWSWPLELWGLLITKWVLFSVQIVQCLTWLMQACCHLRSCHLAVLSVLIKKEMPWAYGPMQGQETFRRQVALFPGHDCVITQLVIMAIRIEQEDTASMWDQTSTYEASHSCCDVKTAGISCPTSEKGLANIA